MARRFFSGNSLEQAILQAASHFGIDPEQIAYSVREKKHGFVNVRRRVVIEVDPETPEKVMEKTPSLPPSPSPSPSPSSTEQTTREDSPEEGQLLTNEPEGGGRVEKAGNETQDQKALRGPNRPESAALAKTQSSEIEPTGPKAKVDGIEQTGKAESNTEFGSKEFGSKEFDSKEFDSKEFDNEENLDEENLDEENQDEDGLHEDLGDEDLGDEDLGDEDDLDEEDQVDGELDEVDAAYEKAVRLLIRLIDLELDYSIEEEDGTFFVEFYGPDSNDLLEDDGEALRAIGHLLPRLVRGLAGESWPCKVDCEGFEEARVQELEELAERVAEEVRTEGKATLLESMNPADRRVVHMALAEDPAVETYSEGDGFMKRVKIVSA